MSDIIRKSQCPECHKHGQDTRGDNLVLYSDGSAYCYACGYYEVSNSSEPRVYVAKERQPPPRRLPLVSHGRVSQKTAALVGEVLDVNLGVKGYTYTNLAGELQAYKMRREDNRWWIGDRTEITWYGFTHAKTVKSDTLVITEGESDCAALVDCGSPYAVVSVPDGCKSDVTKLVKDSISWLRKFRYIVVLFDTDAAGVIGAQKLLEQLPARRSLVALLSSEYKDIASIESLSTRLECVKYAVDAAKVQVKSPFASSSRVVEDALRIIQSIGTKADNSTGFTTLDTYTGGVRPGDLTILLADTGQGKSTLFANLAYQQALAGRKPLFIPLEMTAASMAVKFAEIHLGVRLFSDEPVTVPEAKLVEALQWVTDNIVMTDSFGECSIDTITEWIDAALDTDDIKSVWLDHITAVIEQDWKTAPAFLNALKGLALSRNVSIWSISHTTTAERDSDGTRKVDLRDTRGGQALAQYADCVLGIRRPEGRACSVVELSTLKLHRFVGKYGVSYLEWSRGRYVQSDYVPPADADEGESKTKRKSTVKKKVTNEEERDSGTGHQQLRLSTREEIPQGVSGTTEESKATEVSAVEGVPPGLGTEAGNLPVRPSESASDPSRSVSSTGAIDTAGDERVVLFSRQNQTQTNKTAIPGLSNMPCLSELKQNFRNERKILF
jgi:KaiC/GvpD/RAD55 family RecA-like ATPase